MTNEQFPVLSIDEPMSVPLARFLSTLEECPYSQYMWIVEKSVVNHKVFCCGWLRQILANEEKKCRKPYSQCSDWTLSL